MKIKHRQVLSFDDVILQPGRSNIVSRRKVDISSSLQMGKFGRRLTKPIITAPMTTVVGVDMCKAMTELGGASILHRYCSIEEQVDTYKAVRLGKNGNGEVGAAIGIGFETESAATREHYRQNKSMLPQRIISLYDAGCRMFCIDVAHGHHTSVQDLIYRMKNSSYIHDIHIMAGNIATAEGFHDLQSWGADSVRVGIGSGSICSTRTQTGHGIPVLQSVFDIVESFSWWKRKKATLISDGGIKNAGDAVKALAAGADMIMMGSMLAGTTEAPGNIVDIDGVRHKAYVGMAAKATQVAWRGYSSSDEGVSHHVPFKGRVEFVVEELCNNLRSGLSYSGAYTIPELHKKAVFRVQTSASHIEGGPHIKKVT